MKLLKTLGGLIGGAGKPLPLSGVISFAKEVKKNPTTEGVVKIIAYILAGVGLWYLLYKGVMTFEEVKEIVKILN